MIVWRWLSSDDCSNLHDCTDRKFTDMVSKLLESVRHFMDSYVNILKTEFRHPNREDLSHHLRGSLCQVTVFAIAD